MRRSAGLVATIALVLSLGTGLAGGDVAGASRPGPAVPTDHPTNHPADHPTDHPAARWTPVLLPTGDRVSVGTMHGHIHASYPRTSPSGGHFAQVTAAGRTYVLPAAARFYAGRFLDPELFDVGRIAAMAQIPVRIAPASAAVPGVTVSSRSGTTATGTVTDGTAFGKALWRQFAHDAVPGAAGPTTLLGATRISLAAPTTPAAHPNYPQQTLTLKLIGPYGKPTYGFGLLMNTDDRAKFDNFVDWSGGVAKVSVPLGHYSVVTDFPTFNFAKESVTDRLLQRTDFTFSGPGTTITIDARTATVEPTFSPPRPIGPVDGVFVSTRVDAKHQPGFQYSLNSGADEKVLVAPAPAARVGSEDWVASFSGPGIAGGPAYAYTGAFLSHSISSDQSYAPAQSGFATVHARWYTDGPRREAPFLPLGFSGFDGQLINSTVSTPVARDEYYANTPGLQWLVQAGQDTDQIGFPVGYVDNGTHIYRPGSSYHEDWFRGPLAPGVQSWTGVGPAACTVCRTADTLRVAYSVITDTTATHDAYLALGPEGVDPHTSSRLYADGKLIASDTDDFGPMVTVGRAQARYRIVFTTDRTQDVPPLRGSTVSTMDEAFDSAADAGGSLPEGVGCFYYGRYDSSCRVPSVLLAHVFLPESLTGTLPVGTSTVPFTINHVQWSRTAAITSAGLSTSTDGGRTWTAAPVTALGGGKFRAVVANTTAGAGVSLRVTAADAVGSTMTETTTNAYFVAGS